MMDRIRALFVVACVLTAVIAGADASAAPGNGRGDGPGRERAVANCLAHVAANDGSSEAGGNCEHNWPDNQQVDTP